MEMEYLVNIKETTKKEVVQHSVKLQKYAVTKLCGDFKDWLSFWNQLAGQVDGSTLKEISNFSSLRELVEGQPIGNMVRLSYTAEGYKEAKKILEGSYGKEIKTQKVVITKLANLPEIMSTLER